MKKRFFTARRAAVFFTAALLCAVLFLSGAPKAHAQDLDEILLYQVTVDVNEDATLHIVYHIDWKVLDSSSEGPLSWVTVGIPNPFCDNLRGLSDAVDDLYYTSSGGSCVRVDLDREYYAGDVAEIEFELETKGGPKKQ